jgi:hypothetical protein
VEGSVTGGGLDISGATLELGGAANGVEADFLTGGGQLKLDDAPGFRGAISGFGQAGNTVDLTDVPYVSGETTWSFTENHADTAGALVINDSAAGAQRRQRLARSSRASDAVAGAGLNSRCR